MKSYTVFMPDYIEPPESVADYAFAQALGERFGGMTDLTMQRDNAVHRVPFQRACIAVCNYLGGIESDAAITGDPYSPVIEYVEANVSAEDDPNWIDYISDSRDAV